jgi:competence protein ComGC
MKPYGRIASRIKNLSPAFIREMIVVIVILCLSVILSLPQYYKDKETARHQNNAITKDTSFPVEMTERQEMNKEGLKAGK